MIFVVVANSEEKHKALSASTVFAEHNLHFLTSLAELPEFLKDVPVSGILIDLITSTKACTAEKEATNDIIQLFPHVKIKIVNNEVLVLGAGVSLKQFIYNCTNFTPRTIRKSERKVRHIAFLLSANSEFTCAEKVVTLNISDGGCFIYSTAEWRVGDRVWLRFIDNDKVMTATIRWWQPWGNNKKMPGIGILFD